MAVSATLAVNDEVARRLDAGLPTVPLGFGEAGLPVHPLLVDALAGAAGSAGYGPVAGIDDLRQAAAGYWARRDLPTDADLVVAAPGSKALLWAVLGARGGTVALPRPSWVSYAAQAALHGVAACFVPTVPGEGGVPDPDRLAEAAIAAWLTGRPLTTVVLTLPDNPTGTVATPDTVAALCRVAREHDLLIVSDEIYRDLVHDGAPAVVSPAELAPERVVVTTGLSKNLALGGWRTGVARFPATALGRELRDTVLAVGSEVWSAAARPVQHAAALAFTEPAPLRERIAASRALHARIAGAVADLVVAAGADVVRPNAGFYLYPDFGPLGLDVATGADLAAVLLERHGVATLPGSVFGDDPAALRLRLATSLLYGPDDASREAALASEDPAALPWIAAQLEHLSTALADLAAGR